MSPVIFSTGKKEAAFSMYPLPDESTEALRGKSINNVVVAADKLLMGKQRCDIEEMF